MKKLIALILALVMVCALAACGSKSSDNPADAAKAAADAVKTDASKKDDKKDDKKEDNNKVDSADIKMPDGWDHNPYGWWIDKVYDSGVLPDCFPPEPDDVIVEQTAYKGFTDDILSQRYELGEMQYSDANYEMWRVSFYCTAQQRDEYLEFFTDNGYIGGQTEETPLVHEFYGDGYYVFSETNDNAMTNAGSGKDNLMTVSAVKASFEHPKTFMGNKLPTCGMFCYDPASFSYEPDYTSYDLEKDDGNVEGDYWCARFMYMFVTEDEIKDYTKQLAADGWEILNEEDAPGSEPGNKGSYNANLIKDDLVVSIDADWDYYDCWVAFATEFDYISY